jgi:hypothetical protein
MDKYMETVNGTMMPAHVISGIEHFIFSSLQNVHLNLCCSQYIYLTCYFLLYEDKRALCHCSYNAEKKKVGEYITTPIWSFRMKCHLCTNYIEIKTEPKVSNSLILLQLASLSSSIKGL